MTSTRNPGRFAGLLYVLMSIPGLFALIYVPSKLIVHGNATATANNIAASETLFRLGIACNLISQAGFIFVALARESHSIAFFADDWVITSAAKAVFKKVLLPQR